MGYILEANILDYMNDMNYKFYSLYNKKIIVYYII